MSGLQLPHVFAQLSGQQPSSFLDDNFNYLLGLIESLMTALSITGTPPSTGTVGTAYDFKPQASGGAAPYTFSQTGTLPPGLSFSTATGELSGTPGTAGTYSDLSISVTDSLGHTAQLAADPFTITIASAGASPRLDFRQPSNSQYVPVLAA